MVYIATPHLLLRDWEEEDILPFVRMNSDKEVMEFFITTLTLYKAKVDIIVLDSAHGHSQNVINALKKVKAAYPDLPVIAGNVATVLAAM